MTGGRRSVASGERGAATVVACLAMLALVSVAVLVVSLGSAVSARHRAQSAADLAALATAAALGRGQRAACAAADDIAGRMHARVRECRTEGWDAVVTVAVTAPLVAVGPGEAVAAARAGPMD
ncbi:Rv3654c family TadE-like protein [Rhodococcus tukisamuensis]|uniref:Helicase/secretion neighborhood TadE-like protein n=1 Tax=Rhodococcus tukisamuensis TaxID=168276 RepID=A0A1G6N4M1_9NOCA|nr:Rv3654c family TadE-like protein [Rhodococcus tukisamuensis]SDC62404.1 helicase/secretion neighborhood TadE-like protein [Rhodococcus tukisamuensis]